jgi:NAD(P)-dependent dehydrogenase (short-subunit alcohol dehydrogenase family)
MSQLKSAFVTGADRGLGLALCAGLLQQGWQVFAGQYIPEWPELNHLAEQNPGRFLRIALDVGSNDSVQQAAAEVTTRTDRLDMLINNAGITAPSMHVPIREAQNYADMQRMYNVNTLGPLRMVEAFLPLLERGELKRLCFISSEAGSVATARRTSWFGYCMSKSALNMAVKILFNDLRPTGYTFRLYHPGWIRSYMSGEKNLEADLEPQEAAEYAIPILINPRPDENCLNLVDYKNQEWPW